VEADRPLGRLAIPASLIRGLHAVVDGVADQMEEGIGKSLQDPTVDLGVLAPGLETHLLAGLPGQVTDGPAEPRGERHDRDHPGVEGQLLQLVEGADEVAVLGETGGIALQALEQGASEAEGGG